MDKIAAAEATGIKVHIVTQFCFDATAILQWIRRLRDFVSRSYASNRNAGSNARLD